MKHIDDPVRLQKEILKKTCYLAVIPVLYSLVSGEWATLLGLLFGLLIGTLIFRLRLINIERSLQMSEGKATSFIRNRYFIEYAIYLAVLLVARKNPSVNFLATAIGLFFIKFTVIGWVIIDLIRDAFNQKLESFKR